MKSSLIPGLLGASLALWGSPALAQDAPVEKKQRIVLKQQGKADQDLLAKAAKLSAKASELAAAGKAEEAAEYAAQAAAILKEHAAKSAQQAELKARYAEQKAAEQEKVRRIRIEAKSEEEAQRALERALRAEQERAAQSGDQREREVRVRIEQAKEAMDQHHADMQEHRIRMDLHRENMQEHEAQIELLREHVGDLGVDASALHERLITIHPEIQGLADGRIEMRVHTELENLHEHLAQMGDLHQHFGELEGLQDLNIELGEIHDLALAMPHAEGIDARAYALAIPGGQGTWTMDLSACEECECEDGCDDCEGQPQAQALRYFLDATEGQQQGKMLFVPQGGNTSFGWTTEAPKGQAGIRMGLPQAHGEHEVHVLRAGEGGEIEIHGGDGHQTIIIHGRVMMGGQPEQRFEWRTDRGNNQEVDVLFAPQSPGGQVHGFSFPTPPTPPTPPAAPKAPQAPKAPKAPSAPNVFFAPKADSGDVQEWITEDGKKVQIRTNKVRPKAKDASAPAPSKPRDDEVKKLVEEMRAEMEALRQELSDLRRQMQDDPLVRAQLQRSLEPSSLGDARVAALVDRKRAGLDR